MKYEKELKKCDTLLEGIFNTLMSKEEIEKIRFELLVSDKEAFDPNIKKTFLKKYLSYLFPIGKVKDYSTSILLYFFHFMASAGSGILSLTVLNVFNNGNFSMPVFIAFELIANFIVVMCYRHELVKEQQMIEEKLKFNREKIWSDFLENNSSFNYEYLKNKKFNKDQLSELVNFIQKNLSQNKIIKILEDSGCHEEFTSPESIYTLLSNIRYELKEKVKKEEKEKEKQCKIEEIQKIFSSFKKEESNTVEKIKV
jgi:hypothetical protein